MNKTIAIMTTILLVGSMTSFAGAEGIPAWVKNNAGWWADGTISESEFVQGIQFLIKDGVIVIPSTTISGENSQSVPVWIKNNAGWWADGIITDTEFVQAIQHLIKTEVISIPTSESKSSDSAPKTTTDGSQLVSLQSDLDKCKEIFQAYERYHCVDKAKMKITEYDYEQKSTQYVVGSATFYFPGAELEISPLGQALLTIKMLVKNTGSNENVSLFCTGPAVCNYDVWDGQNVFHYSTTDFTNGNIVLTPGTSREFSILFGPQIPIPGSTKFVYDPTKEYFFRISEPWGSASIPLALQ